MSGSEDGNEVKLTPEVMTMDTSNKNETTMKNLLLLEEIRKLRNVIHELTGRLKFLEGFLAEIYGEKFHEFLAKRERLESAIGLKSSEDENESFDGRRSSESRDLVDLMKIMRVDETKVKTADQTETEIPVAAYHQQSPPKIDINVKAESQLSTSESTAGTSDSFSSRNENYVADLYTSLRICRVLTEDRALIHSMLGAGVKVCVDVDPPVALGFGVDRPSVALAQAQAQLRFPVPVSTMQNEVVAPQEFVSAETQTGVKTFHGRSKRKKFREPRSYFCGKCSRDYYTKHKMELHESTCTSTTTYQRRKPRPTM